MRGLAELQREGRIAHLGLTNFDTDHLRLLVMHGFPIVSNQVCFSLLDRRAGEEMSRFCLERGIGILAYGTLAGGFLSDRWLGRPEPDTIGDWSKLKYKRFIDAVGGWDVLQTVLAALRGVARRHGVSVANVATRWVLEQPAVAAVIVGARLGESEHRADNLRLFSFALDEEDLARIDAALAHTTRIPGDCGDEYRRPPFLTASGDLSHHLGGFPPVFQASAGARPHRSAPGRFRQRLGADRRLQPGRADRRPHPGQRHHRDARPAARWSAPATRMARPSISSTRSQPASRHWAGRSRMSCVRASMSATPANGSRSPRAHGRRFGDIRPANTLVEAKLIGDYEVEIEAEAVVR